MPKHARLATNLRTFPDLMLPLLAALVVSATIDSTGYWQQEVAYDIVATLDEPSGVLTGRARITYVNHSPDTLHDFYVHQYLNAFRPGSRWAAADAAEERVRFQGLADPDYAFERITAARLRDVPAAPVYPYAPDSTVAHWALAEPLEPGDTLVAEIEWRARPSTLPRRQGRQGRRFDFAQWYPKVVVYDRLGWQHHPLYPAGEFYGEFATYDVSLLLPQDQVIAATGVPVEGDPGWERAKAHPQQAIDYQRNWYGSASRRPLDSAYPGDVDARRGCRDVSVVAGMKCVRFHARDVHHFAFSLNPGYVYEEGRFEDVVVRVLYLPEDAGEWGGGIAVQRTEAAIAWLQQLFGEYPWPQITNLHRIEGGGTEFPMVIMDGSASLGLIVHEVGHQYAMGILANNEWRDAWLDEGFTSFQSGLFFEATGGPPAYPGVESRILFSDIDRWSQPIATVSERFRDFTTYGTMVYAKGQLFFEQLRYVVGDDAMLRILRTFYQRWKLKHVDETGFRRIAEEVSGQDLGWLFGQWLHGTPLIDYRLKDVERERLADGRWHTTVTVERLGDGWMPLEIGDKDRVYARTTGQEEVERVQFTSAERPGRLVLDPRVRGHDWNMLNNAERGWLGSRGSGAGGVEWRIDDPTRERVRRDRLVSALMPVAWSSDHGGLTLGLRRRANYLGRYKRDLLLATYALGDGATERPGLYVSTRDPVGGAARSETGLAAWWVEGRAGVAVSAERMFRRHRDFGAERRVGFDGMWMATTDLEYLDPGRWEDAGTVEAGPWVSVEQRRGEVVTRVRVGARVGVLYWQPGLGARSSHRYDFERFIRASGAASARVPGPFGATLGARVYAGGYLGESPPPRQRRIMVAGADAYETFTNPLLRSRGALFVRRDFHYHAPGGANLRGFSPRVGGRWAVSVNLEGVRPVLRREYGVLRQVALTAFVDAAAVDTLAVSASTGGRWFTPLYDGGLGVVTRHALGDLLWTMRFELPVVVSRPPYAADADRLDGRLALRWQVSLESSF